MTKNKNIMPIMIAILLLAIFFIIFWYINNTSTKSYKNDIYELKYDTTWKIKTKTDTSLKLIHDSKSEIEIYLIELDEKTVNENIEDIAKELELNIKSNYKDYKTINNTSFKITKKSYDGYQMLFENGKSQQLVALGKSSKYIFVINYTSSNYYFDMLLDSVNTIIYNFSI